MRALGYSAFAALQAPAVQEPVEGFGAGIFDLIERVSPGSEPVLAAFGHQVLGFLQPSDMNEAGGAFGTGIFGLIERASLLSQVVLAALVLFSIASWAVILFKLWQFRRVEAQTTTFVEVFRKSRKFSDVQSVCKSLAASPLAGVFEAGYVELNTQLRQPEAQAADRAGSPAGEPVLRSFDALDRALLRASNVEVTKLERHVPMLATTASITPFIGLFGTVWGIIIAFQGIGETGSTNLAAVAPGIAEALVATLAGLFAAIPAVYFYNHLTQKVKVTASTVDDFSLEFLNIAERHFSG